MQVLSDDLLNRMREYYIKSFNDAGRENVARMVRDDDSYFFGLILTNEKDLFNNNGVH